jgi:2,4-dienoyl-CoA reductase-like NADH-dependent reductase (Old Yellow Enzyme family)
MMTSQLFTPIALRGLTLPNRIVVAPMCQYSAIDGSATDWHIMHLGSFAVAGPGLVMIEATGVEAAGRITPGCTGLYSDANEAAMKRAIGALP